MESEETGDYLVDGLREQVALKQGPDDGTVITFTYVYDLEPKPKHQEKYQYAAIWIAKKSLWYLSGAARNSVVPESIAHDDFTTLLARPNVKKAWVVTEQVRFKP